MIETTKLPRTIWLKGNKPRIEEGRAAGAIKPGHLIATDLNNALIVHATAGGPAAANFAMEDPKASGGTIDDAYAATDLVMYGKAKKGDEIYGWLATGMSVTPASFLESDGAGGFRLLTTGIALAKPRETLNNATGAQARLKIEVL